MTSYQGLNRSAPGVRLGDMRSVQDCAAAMVNKDAQYDLTAYAPATQADATQLINGLNHVSTVAGSADSVQLPAASKGSVVAVVNAGANPMQVFGKEGRSDTINGTAGSTGVSQTNGLTALYICPKDGAWFRLLSA